jgi:4-amino-4-deoxy-L-arabinose transferase-like glycosyltransferase
MESMNRQLLPSKIWAQWLIALFLLAGSFALRMINLTQPPLETHPTRQLRAAIMARGIYYQTLTDVPDWMREHAISEGKKEPIIEPPIMENLMAFLYKISGGERLWLAKIISTVFWMLGGLALWRMVRDLAGSTAGLVSMAFFLFLPGAVLASRTFQPDPLMTASIIWSWWGFNRWRKSGQTGDAILAGLLCGLSILIKNVSVFFLFFPIALVIFTRGLIKSLRDRSVWIIAVLAVVPGMLFTVYGTLISGFMTQQFNLRFFPNLWIQPGNYIRWFNMINDTVGYGAVIIGLIGLLIYKMGEDRKFILGMWIGYAVYGFTFAYHIGTHSYYQLPLIAIVAVSIGSIGGFTAAGVSESNPRFWQRMLAYLVLIAAVMMASLPSYSLLIKKDYKKEVAFWEKLGEQLRGAKLVGITQDYGYRLSYFGWETIENWPASGDVYVRQLAGKQTKTFDEVFLERVEGKDYFLITWFEEYARQDELKAYLDSHYPVTSSADYLLFDLNHPLHE